MEAGWSRRKAFSARSQGRVWAWMRDRRIERLKRAFMGLSAAIGSCRGLRLPQRPGPSGHGQKPIADYGGFGRRLCTQPRRKPPIGGRAGKDGKAGEGTSAFLSLTRKIFAAASPGEDSHPIPLQQPTQTNGQNRKLDRLCQVLKAIKCRSALRGFRRSQSLRPIILCLRLTRASPVPIRYLAKRL